VWSPKETLCLQLGIMHCDLKPSNMLLVRAPEHRRSVIVKLSDFGLSKILPCGKDYIANTNIGGTISWAAPECLIPSTPLDASYILSLLSTVIYSSTQQRSIA
jgi:serine/threonine protein kinase